MDDQNSCKHFHNRLKRILLHHKWCPSQEHPLSNIILWSHTINAEEKQLFFKKRICRSRQTRPRSLDDLYQTASKHLSSAHVIRNIRGTLTEPLYLIR